MMPDGLIDETVEVPTISGATPPDEITTRLLEIKGMSYQPFAWADTLNQGVADIPARMNAIEQQLAALTGAASYEADTLIGVRDSVSQNSYITSQIASLDGYKSEGNYRVSNCQAAPSSSKYGMLHVLGSGNNVTQIFIQDYAADNYVRTCIAGEWRQWVKL